MTDKAASILVLVGFALVATFPTSCTIAKCSGGINPTYSQGLRSGQMTKFSVKGIVYKSGEGEILLGGMESHTVNKSTTYVPRVFEFSAQDPKIIEQLESAVGKQVVIHYSQFFIAPFAIDTSYVVTKVEVID